MSPASARTSTAAPPLRIDSATSPVSADPASAVAEPRELAVSAMLLPVRATVSAPKPM